MPRAVIIRGGVKHEAEIKKGTTIMDMLQGENIYFAAPCGGRGQCGKCAVIAHGALPALTENEKRHLSPSQIKEGVRLACEAVILGDTEITLPDMTGTAVETGTAATDNGTDINRPRPSVLIQYDGEKYNVLSNGRVIDSRAERPAVIGMAADIGTTTVAARFYELSSGEELGSETAVNPQTAHGADVISRIAACGKTGLETLSSEIRGLLSGMAADFCRKTGIDKSFIYRCVVAGNTVMEHIAAGISPTGMGASPYKPATLFGYDIGARTLGLTISENANVYFSPCVSGFIGGDITAGLLACGFNKTDGPALFADIGTNGEMALITPDGILCCSAAAGPAFEGAHISCGVGSVSGAINHVDFDGETARFTTIGGGAPIGICGSGLIDIAAGLLKTGHLDETGRLTAGTEDERRGAYFPVGDSGFYITQRDLREVQLAKSAIASGIATLLHESGLKPRDIRRFYAAGGFGSRMDIESAFKIGLFPRDFAGISEGVGNASLSGAGIMLLDDNSLEAARLIAGRCREIDLGSNGFWNDRFIENMYFAAI